MYRTLLLATALTVGFAGAAVAQEVTIGLTMGTTGPGASLGIHYKNAFQLMPKTIGGYPVKFIMLEDKTDATEAAKNARQLITEDKVDAFMGSVAVPSTTQLAQIANELKTPLMALSPVALPPEKLRMDFRRAAADDADDERRGRPHEGERREDRRLYRLLRLVGRHRSQVARAGWPDRLESRSSATSAMRAPTPASPARCSR